MKNLTDFHIAVETGLDQHLRTARRQLNGRYLLFGEYFAELNNPLSSKLAK